MRTENIDMEDCAWCIYIDVLGFSNMWQEHDGFTKSIMTLGTLMQGIFRIGTCLYINYGDRVFVQQTGDGFSIVHYTHLSLSHNSCMEYPASIAIALMRHVNYYTGRFTQAAIARGDSSDIQSCYPEEVMNARDETGVIRLGGGGIMAHTSSMGSAFIRAARMHNNLSGPSLILHKSHCNNLGNVEYKLIRSRKSSEKFVCIDWIRNKSDVIKHIQKESDLAKPSPCTLMKNINQYVRDNPSLKEKWSYLIDEMEWRFPKICP